MYKHYHPKIYPSLIVDKIGRLRRMFNVAYALKSSIHPLND
jgi:hypothetical protein